MYSRMTCAAGISCARLNQLICDFLTYARPGPCNPEPVGVAEAVAGVLALFESVSPEPVNLDVAIEAAVGARTRNSLLGFQYRGLLEFTKAVKKRMAQARSGRPGCSS